VLINNAGICLDEERTAAPTLRAFQETLNVNTFGAALTTEAFIPLLSASPAPRIVFISSFVGSLTHRWGNPVELPIYRSSKSALNMLILHYASNYKDDGWKINASCPGYCATNLNVFPGTDSPANGALNAVRMATLGEQGETGTFSSKEGVMAW
jgi:NAD(P)-dependent dehydrogenase (short-subunit alcohol dehydrogenase family)